MCKSSESDFASNSFSTRAPAFTRKRKCNPAKKIGAIPCAPSARRLRARDSPPPRHDRSAASAVPSRAGHPFPRIRSGAEVIETGILDGLRRNANRSEIVWAPGCSARLESLSKLDRSRRRTAYPPSQTPRKPPKLGEAPWALRDLNPQPPRCKRGALAVELRARAGRDPPYQVGSGKESRHSGRIKSRSGSNTSQVSPTSRHCMTAFDLPIRFWFPLLRLRIRLLRE